MAYTITTFSGAKRLSFQAATITGSTVNLNTGLNTIENVQACVKVAAQAAGDPGYVTVNFSGTDGLVNVYAWDDAGSAAANAKPILLIVIGT